MPLQRAVAYLRNSLWFIPGLWVIGAGILAFVMILVDRATGNLAADYPLIFGGGPDGARSLLSSIASSSITVAGVTFSITIVALQLASSQFSPRVLRNFMRDRVSQVVLGSFLGAFLYSLLVLRSIRSEGEGDAAFVPSLAVTVAILLAIVAVAMLVFFIHHISTRIQVANIVAEIARDTTSHVAAEWPEPKDGPDEAPELADADARVIPARQSGYLQLVGHKGLVHAASELDLIVRLERRPGEWVQEGVGLFSVWPGTALSEDQEHRLFADLTLGAQRSLEQDVAFGIRQLVDVAIKALSPGINDPTSANDCIHRLMEILVLVGRRREPQRVLHDDEGQARVILAVRTFDELVGLAFDEIRHYGTGTPAVVLSVASAIDGIISATPRHRHEPLRRQLPLLVDAAKAIEPKGDRERVLARLSRVGAS